MTDVNTSDAKIAKIIALLDKTTERGCSPEEAEAAFTKAQALMTKYAIDDALLSAARGDKLEADEIVTDKTVTVSGSYMNQMGRLWQGLAKVNDCHMYWSGFSGKQSRVVFITGFRSDVQRVLLLGASLQLQLARELRACKPTYDSWDGRSKGMQAFVYRRSFADGWVGRIVVRLKEVREATVQTASAGSSTLLPALLDRKKQVDRYVAETTRLVKSRGGGQRSYSYQGAGAGREAANRADLGQTRVGGSHKAIGH